MLDGRLTFSRASPYLGVGWGLTPTPGSRLYFSADVGVLYQRPSAMLKGCGPVLSASVCTQLAGRFATHDREPDISALKAQTTAARLYLGDIGVGFGLRFYASFSADRARNEHRARALDQRAPQAAVNFLNVELLAIGWPQANLHAVGSRAHSD